MTTIALSRRALNISMWMIFELVSSIGSARRELPPCRALNENAIDLVQVELSSLPSLNGWTSKASRRSKRRGQVRETIRYKH